MRALTYLNLFLRTRDVTRNLRVSCSRAIRSQPRATAAGLVFSGAGVLGVAAKAKEHHGTDPDSTFQSFYKSTSVRKKFLSLASVSYQDEPFITGADFIATLSQDSTARANDGEMEVLTEEEYTRLMDKACRIDMEANDNFLDSTEFLISYSEFLFLLSVIVKPVDQFYRHFKILDQADTNSLSKEEFLSVENLTCGGKNPMHTVSTSLRVLFFGPEQDKEINFDQFSQFLTGVQKQCWKAEFDRYSEGENFITDDEFMRLLLRRTNIPDIRKARYIDRLEHRPEHTRKRILFHQFCQFMNLLNDFPDFEVAIRMFAITKKPLTKKDFQRAVKASTGSVFDTDLVDVIFDVFDEDNDDKLGHDEFITVMKDKIKSRNSGFYVKPDHISDDGWDAYKHCVRQYMYKSYA